MSQVFNNSKRKTYLPPKGSGTCARGVPLLPTPPFPHAKYWLRYLCNGVPLLPTPPFHHTKYWLRYACKGVSPGTTPRHPVLPTYKIFAPVCVQRSTTWYHSSPSRPSHIQNICSGMCAKEYHLVPLLATPSFQHTKYWLQYVCKEMNK